MSGRDLPPLTPAVPLHVLVQAHRALLLAHTTPGLPTEQRLLAAAAAGEMGYYVTKLLADQQVAVRVPA